MKKNTFDYIQYPLDILKKFEIEKLPQVDIEYLHKTSINNIHCDEVLLYG